VSPARFKSPEPIPARESLTLFELRPFGAAFLFVHADMSVERKDKMVSRTAGSSERHVFAAAI
jgi:hypothetical protein